MKPTNPKMDEPAVRRAAREKIAADLAHELGLPVPPAVLTKRESPPRDCAEAVVVTLVMYPIQWPWGIIRGQAVDDSPMGLALASMLGDCSRMLVFDTWLQQTDHNNHENNIVFGYDPDRCSDCQLIFLDYAYSMGSHGQWANNGWKEGGLVGFPPLMLENKRDDIMAEIVKEIGELPEASIMEIVNRIPDSHLRPDHKATILGGLLGRRTILPDIFDVPPSEPEQE